MGQGLVDAGSVLVCDGVRGTESHVLVNQMLRLAEALPAAQRTAVHLAYVEGLSYREIADAMHVPVGTVMSRLADGAGKTHRKRDAKQSGYVVARQIRTQTFASQRWCRHKLQGRQLGYFLAVYS